MQVDIKVHSDIGTKKNVNQDAVLVKQAVSDKYGKIVFAVLCDGMGGLSCGEVASASVLKRMDTWFKLELPLLLNSKDQTAVLNTSEVIHESGDRLFCKIKSHWTTLSQELNKKLAEYGREQNISIGTTIVCILVLQNHYIAMNVGDSRLYEIKSDTVKVISHDHSYIQKEIDEGRLTVEEAKVSNQKSVLLQCIGASNVVIPEFYEGEITADTSYLLCSDGMWRELCNEDFVRYSLEDNALQQWIETVKQAGETDNISGILLRIN
ncbi:MAG: serine/threonine-protein phosphatase [Pseudobutyrivibrio sp.]|nr:serine/threonine-protein phosphatase [Pseudobutyrivibrio sp.]